MKGMWFVFSAGQDVVVTFDGEEYVGEVIEHQRGWVTARVLIDPLTDHGRISPMLGATAIVNVRESFVRLPDDRPEQDKQEVLSASQDFEGEGG